MPQVSKKTPMSWPAAATAIATMATVATILSSILIPDKSEPVTSEELHIKKHLVISSKLEKHLKVSENNFKQINQRLDTLLKAVLSKK